ncbi:MAG: biotin--[acetyl-CoA-carboxylase] ligase [Actinomycetales bacterium]|nr:MAG: biotin--[acetyl-CoA-carboxylase] ligase [Actinomycetales bacterium]
MRSATDPALLSRQLCPPNGVWRLVEVHDRLGSTNARAAEIGQPWSVVLSDHQTAGRGRLARAWEAPPRTSVALSAVVPAPDVGLGWVPLLAGLAVAEAIRSFTGLTAVLKWPNDVLLPSDDHRKVCGVLCEYRAALGAEPVSTPAGGRADRVVVGIGINQAQSRGQLPVETATSLVLAGARTQVATDTTGLVTAVLSRLAAAVTAWQSGDPGRERLRAAYRAHSVTIGADVALSLPGDRTVHGRALAVDDAGAVVVDSGAGPLAYPAGDVVHLRLG